MTTVTHLGFLTQEALRLGPDRPALRQEGLTLTFGELEERASRVAGWLHRRGVAPGDRVALLWPNDVRFVECWLGIMRAGAVAVPLNIRQPDESLAYVLADSGAAGMLVSDELTERAETLRPAGGFCAGTSELQDTAPLADCPAVGPDDVCMQPYTSGSTGKPKGVLLTHRGQIWCADVVRKCFMTDETEVALLAAPLYHKNAAVTLKVFLLAGGCCVVLPGFESSAVIEAIDTYKITYLSGVPAMFRMLLNDTESLAKHDVSSVRFATAGSAVVTPDLLEGFTQTFGAPIAEGYGLTEGGPDVFLSPRWGIRKPGALGLPVPGCEVRLAPLDDENGEAGEGEVGELWVRNPGVTVGYHRLPEVTAERLRDGWLATRDLIRRDSDGYYYFVGRRDDLMNVAGENVYPREVEELLLRHPDVRDVAVVPAPHPVKGQIPVAYVVLSQPGAVSAADLVAFFHEHGPHYAYPRFITFVDALPLAGTGKVDRALLTARAAGENYSPRT
ncbi:MAG TPA: class I adenylate-forming enzyme family protein [Streptosporangiaceae bacterium]|nr:class I adenylate-forming enzyme family protein [Streptosporangiaceae bacterium]